MTYTRSPRWWEELAVVLSVVAVPLCALAALIFLAYAYGLI